MPTASIQTAADIVNIIRQQWVKAMFLFQIGNVYTLLSVFILNYRSWIIPPPPALRAMAGLHVTAAWKRLKSQVCFRAPGPPAPFTNTSTAFPRNLVKTSALRLLFCWTNHSTAFSRPLGNQVCLAVKNEKSENRLKPPGGLRVMLIGCSLIHKI